MTVPKNTILKQKQDRTPCHTNNIRGRIQGQSRSPTHAVGKGAMSVVLRIITIFHTLLFD